MKYTITFFGTLVMIIIIGELLMIRTPETNEELICSFETEFHSYEIFYELNDEVFIVKKGFLRENVTTYRDKPFLDRLLERNLNMNWVNLNEKGYYKKADSIGKLRYNGQSPKEKIDYIKKDIIAHEKHRQRIILDKEKKLKLYLDLDCRK